jgi:hypothetical protein
MLMALDLTNPRGLVLGIEVVGAEQAQAALRNVETASKSVATSARAAGAALDDAVADKPAAISKVVDAFNRLEAGGRAAFQAIGNQLGNMEQQLARLAGLGGGTGRAISAFEDLGAALGASTAAMGGLAAATVAGAAALGGMTRFVVSSSEEYFSHAQSMAGARAELDRLTGSWHAWRDAIGAVTLGGQEGLTGTFSLLHSLLDQIGARLVSNIALGQAFWGTMLGGGMGGMLLGTVQAVGAATLPPISTGVGSRDTVRRGFADFGALDPSTWTSDPAWQREQKRLAAERLRQAEAAQRERARQAAAIQNLLDHGVPYSLGWPGALPGQKLNMAAAGFDYAKVPEIGYHVGLPGWATENAQQFTGADLLKQMNVPQSIFGQVFDSLATSGDFLLKSLLGGRDSNLGGYVGGSLAGGLTKGGLGKTISSGLSSIFGKSIGSAIGSFIPFGGELLGSLIGKMFGPTQYEQRERSANASIADLWKTMNGQYGGSADPALSIFGFNTTELHGKGFQGAMGLDPLKAQFDELAKRQSEFNGNLGDTLGKIQQLGGNIPDALRPYLEQLKNAKTLTQDNLDLIAKMTGDAVPDYHAMEEAAQRLGVSTNALGQSFQNAKANANWQSVIDDLDTLTRGGADMNALLGDEGLQGKFNELVQQSQQFGTTIPSNMRPWMQQLIDSGKLLGADHKAITDINQLHFGGDMQTTLDALNQTLQHLIDALNVGLPNAARHAGQTWRDELGDLPVPGAGGRGGDGSGPLGGDPGQAAASRVGGTAVINIDGRTMAEIVVPHIPGVVDRYGLSRR